MMDYTAGYPAMLPVVAQRLRNVLRVYANMLPRTLYGWVRRTRPVCCTSNVRPRVLDTLRFVCQFYAGLVLPAYRGSQPLIPFAAARRGCLPVNTLYLHTRPDYTYLDAASGTAHSDYALQRGCMQDTLVRFVP